MGRGDRPAAVFHLAPAAEHQVGHNERAAAEAVLERHHAEVDGRGDLFQPGIGARDVVPCSHRVQDLRGRHRGVDAVVRDAVERVDCERDRIRIVRPSAAGG